MDVLVFGAHPDDIEFGCGGILAKMAKLGYSLTLVDLTSGEKGSHGSSKERQSEGEASAALLGAKRLFLDFPDCAIFDSYSSRLKLVEVLRTFRPKLVLAPHWKEELTHPDHSATSHLSRIACRLARFKNLLPDRAPHTVDGILHYGGFNAEIPPFLIDVSDVVEKWKEMMNCHKSQQKTGPYSEWNLKQAAKLGVLAGCEYAQGLYSQNPLLIEDPMTIAKGSREI